MKRAYTSHLSNVLLRDEIINLQKNAITLCRIHQFACGYIQILQMVTDSILHSQECQGNINRKQ